MRMPSTLRYSGSFNVSKPINEAGEFLLDLERVAPCIPNVVSYSVEGGKAKVVFRVELGDEVPIAELRRVTANTEIQVMPLESSIRYLIKGRAVGSNLGITLDLSVRQAGDSSIIDWAAEAELGRLFSMMARFVDMDSMIKRIAQDTINGIVKCMDGKT